jgi:RNA polymerase sigma-70 factor (ECF subfamily)
MNTRHQSDRIDIEGLFREYAPNIRGAAMKIVRDSDDADDALQETFLAAHRFRERFEPLKVTPLPWLYRIAQRKALDIVRARTRSARRRHDAPLVAVSAEDEAFAVLRTHRLRALVLGEPVAAAQLVDRLSIDDISGQFSIPAATVKSRLRRQKRRLREALTRDALDA